jgi:hypothetical protein
MCYVHCHHATLKTSPLSIFFATPLSFSLYVFSYVHFLSFFATNLSIFLLLAHFPPLLLCCSFSIVTHKVASCSCILMLIVYGFFVIVHQIQLFVVAYHVQLFTTHLVMLSSLSLFLVQVCFYSSLFWSWFITHVLWLLHVLQMCSCCKCHFGCLLLIIHAFWLLLIIQALQLLFIAQECLLLLLFFGLVASCLSL